MISITEFLQKGKFKQSDVVDLDLPSGLKWASCNVGANKPEESGLLFQWGRVDGYKYDDNNHGFLSNDEYTTTSGKEYKPADILKPEDDAAYQATQGKLRMPTKDEIDELIRHTDNEWTELNGVNGIKFISKKDKDKWIFIPAGGTFLLLFDDFYSGNFNGYVWTSSSNSDNSFNAYSLFFNSNHLQCDNENHSCGFSVRGVCK